MPETTRKEVVLGASFMAGAVIGALVGASSALFIPPHAGRELKKQLSTKYGDLAKKAEAFVDYLGEAASKAPKKKESSSQIASGKETTQLSQ